MAHDLRKLAPAKGMAVQTLGAGDLVQMKPPSHPVKGIIVGGEPLVSGGVSYWQVAWMFEGEKRLGWSPQSTLLRVPAESDA